MIALKFRLTVEIRNLEPVPLSRETDILKRFFAAINRNDLPAIAKDFDPQIVRIEPEG